jgi:hypothetical protein
MKTQISTDIYQGKSLNWNVIIYLNDLYVTTVTVRTKTQAIELSRSRKRLRECLEVGKILS